MKTLLSAAWFIGLLLIVGCTGEVSDSEASSDVEATIELSAEEESLLEVVEDSTAIEEITPENYEEALEQLEAEIDDN